MPEGADFNIDDYEQLTDFLTEASDYSLAGHIIRNGSEAELTKLLADGWALQRHFANMVADFAMVLGRIPTEEMAKGLAEKLAEASAMVLAALPKAEESDD